MAKTEDSLFDEIIETRIAPNCTVEERRVTEDALNAEVMQEACGMFLTAERRFGKLNANRDCITDPCLNAMWWDALEDVYEKERTVWRMFVGSQPDLASNKLYARFRELLLKGSRLKANA